jgi:pyruvate dehydrogenase E2 component (dihydrolipoamide acetyltransferase)
MPTEIILPRVDMDMTAGRIARWHVEEGQKVEKGALLFDLETSKAAMEIEAPASGVLRRPVASGEREIPVGEVVGWIYGPDEPFTDAVAGPAAAAERTAPTASAAAAPPTTAEVASRPGTGVAATPLARRLARERGVELAALTGSGARGRIQAADVPVGPAPARPTAVSHPIAATSSSPAVHRVWLRKGHGTPTVMLHGFGSELDSWRQLVNAVPAAGPVLALDLPAHGKSAALPAAGFDGLVEAVEAALVAEDVTTAHLLGHSLGGAVATALAGRAVVAARTLLLIAPAGLGPEINGAFLDGFLRARRAESLAPWLAMTVTDPRSLPRDFLAVSLRPRQRDGYLDGLAALADGVFPDGTQAFEVRTTLNALTMPRRVVFGRDDRIIPATHAAGLAGAIAVHLYAGVGHMPQLEIRSDIEKIWLEVIRSAG